MPIDPSQVPPPLVVPVGADRAGVVGPTPRQVRGRAWRRTSHGLFVPSSVERTVEQRILEAAVLIPRSGAVTGWAALRWSGGSWFDGMTADGLDALPVTLVTAADDLRPQPGVAVSHERLDPAEIRWVRGVPVAVPERAVFFEMRYAASVRAAIIPMDMAAADDLTTIDEVATYTYAHPGWTGVGQARDALPFADENAWSPWEVRLRSVWVIDAGLPPPLCNRPVFDLAGHHLGTPDVIDPVTGAYGEYDGVVHLTGRRRAADLAREQVFRDHGLEGFTVVAADMRDRLAVARRIAATQERAARVPSSSKRWTLELPPWWQPAHTVELRRQLRGRALAALQRRRALHAS